MLGFSQFKKDNSCVLPIIAQTPSTGNGLEQMNPAHSASTAPTVLIGNNGVVSPEFGQPSHSQQLVSPGKVTNNIVAVRDPFGSQSAMSQTSIGHLDSSSLIQHGIASMPVSDKLAAVKVSSFLTSRHLSRRPLKVHARKYNSKSDGPKVAFFDHIVETENKLKVYDFLIPLENPRSVFGDSTVLTHLISIKDGALSLNSASDVQYEDENLAIENAKKDQSNHFKSTPFDIRLGKVQSASKEVEKPSTPRLQRSDYFTEPNIQKLASAERTHPGFCTHVMDFVVGRHGYGWVKFDGETNVSGLDLDALIHFNSREVIVYMDDSKKPPVGQGLNRAAEVTLLNI